MRNFRERLGKEILLFDGAAGTMLQAAGLPAGARPEIWNIDNKDEIIRLHRAYIEAGSDLITTNTFGANEFHYPDCEGVPVETVVRAACDAARSAIRASGKDVYIGLDIGPTGKLVGDVGDLDFEDAVRAFARVIRAGRDFADVIILETFGNLAETRAALLAAKENCSLPVIVTNVYGKDGRMFTGTPVAAAATALTALGADAIGMNCSIGPDEMSRLLPSFLEATSLPVAVYPNAGLPRVGEDGKTVYDVTPAQYVSAMIRMAKAGAVILGGCCGTTPEYIRMLRRALGDLKPSRVLPEPKTVVSSSLGTHVIGNGSFTVIGERINPTGKSKLKAALRENNIEYLLTEAHNQSAAGAAILDVNTGLPDIDETKMLTSAVCRIQEVCGLPLEIDSASPEAMEAALRRYHGKALINSVNGSQNSMDQVFPLAAKYGGVVVALTLDEHGIPDTPEGRAAIAGRIIAEAARYGIGREDLIIDPLTLTLGADPQAADKTLSAMRIIKEKYSVCCSLGVSNISFGLPDRESVNCGFLAEAMAAGLDAAIMNPLSEKMMDVVRGTSGIEAGAALADRVGGKVSGQCDPDDLTSCVYFGMKDRASALAKDLCAVRPPLEVISDKILPALERIGKEFETGKVFLPGLLACADSAIAALSVLTERMLADGSRAEPAGKIVLATVRGDIHDIGKNIVKVMLQSYGFDVIDLGRDVPPEAVLNAARECGASIVGLSALMTTTVPAMKETIALLRRELPAVRTVVGGAVLTEDFALSIGADQYAADAMATVRFAQSVCRKNR